MKPLTLALLGSAALAALTPGLAVAQTAPTPAAAPSLNDILGCEDDQGADGSAVSGPTAAAPDTADPTETPDPGSTPTPTPSPTSPTSPATPGTVFGPSDPVVQPLPTPTPTPSSTPAPTTPVGGGSSQTYYTGGAGLTSSVVVDDLGTRTVFRASSNAGSEYRRNLATVNSYSTPGRGIITTIGGQKIGIASSAVTTAGLQSRIVNIIDEIVLSARALGLPDPVITAATNGVHTDTSLHGSGLALDLRCNDQPASKCKAWVAAMKNAFGPGYDVMFELWTPNGNSHVHLEYDGKTADNRVHAPFTMRQELG